MPPGPAAQSALEDLLAGVRPLFGGQHLPGGGETDRLLFYEYFHGDTGAGLGASHQTGWTALVAKLLDRTPAT